ncbi:hypothetical protein C8R45DRAFT_924687 [Mycena sanguinolenta]|nr:hypothetical protein C8R45DRAFT_924687 [Mycena sanguinolenta]
MEPVPSPTLPQTKGPKAKKKPSGKAPVYEYISVFGPTLTRAQIGRQLYSRTRAHLLTCPPDPGQQRQKLRSHCQSYCPDHIHRAPDAEDSNTPKPLPKDVLAHMLAAATHHSVLTLQEDLACTWLALITKNKDAEMALDLGKSTKTKLQQDLDTMRQKLEAATAENVKLESIPHITSSSGDPKPFSDTRQPTRSSSIYPATSPSAQTATHHTHPNYPARQRSPLKAVPQPTQPLHYMSGMYPPQRPGSSYIHDPNQGSSYQPLQLRIRVTQDDILQDIYNSTLPNTLAYWGMRLCLFEGCEQLKEEDLALAQLALTAITMKNKDADIALDLAKSTETKLQPDLHMMCQQLKAATAENYKLFKGILDLNRVHLIMNRSPTYSLDSELSSKAKRLGGLVQ